MFMSGCYQICTQHVHYKQTEGRVTGEKCVFNLSLMIFQWLLQQVLSHQKAVPDDFQLR